MREIDENKIRLLYESISASINEASEASGGILQEEVVYAALGAVIERVDDGSIEFANFFDEALQEMICQADTKVVN